MHTVLRLGTRKSALAWAQSSLVARAIEQQHADIKVVLDGITTQGDLITNVPLYQMDGKEFFVKELDEALLQGRVDLTVHSLKDLSLERPKGIALACVPQRERPEDIIIFNRHVSKKLQRGERIVIGTSSPRRLENIPGFLQKVLPRSDGYTGEHSIEFCEIRGNVNTRLARIHKMSDDKDYLDAVVLAFAGLSRLWQYADTRDEVLQLFSHVRLMVLPLSHCPAAPGQGALAIECRDDDTRTKHIVARLHDAATARRVAKERSLMSEFGGGCHQRFGATCIFHETLGEAMYVRGKTPNDTYVDELKWESPPSVNASAAAGMWDGSKYKGKTVSVGTGVKIDLAERAACFIAHPRAVDASTAAEIAKSEIRVWASGVASWIELAKQGIWVEGCADGLGWATLAKLFAEPLLRLPELKDWLILTHKDAVSGWDEGQVVPTYAVIHELAAQDQQALRDASYIFWGSGNQFDAFKKYVNPGATHACGPGKTAEKLKHEPARSFHVFPSAKVWREWITNQQ